MNSAMQIVNGFLWGTGLILAVAVFERLFHMGICH